MTLLMGGFPKAQRGKIERWSLGRPETMIPQPTLGGWKTDKEEVDDQMDDLIQKAAHGEGGHRLDNGISSPLTNNCSAWKLNSTSLFIRHKSTSPKLASLKKKPHESREKLRVKCPRIRTLRKRETKNSSQILTMTKKRSIRPSREHLVVKASKRRRHRRNQRGDQQLVKCPRVWHLWRTQRRHRRNPLRRWRNKHPLLR
mmetsp:Transcript_427/g.1134  ORF Transcript_427/g.1134 Transcript_427/m.1134 type:complete len:200 (-) Transcript_427:602-1201(-)